VGCGKKFVNSLAEKEIEGKQKDLKKYRLWVKRGKHGIKFCFIPAILLPWWGYYFLGAGWRGLSVTVIGNILVTIMSNSSILIPFIFLYYGFIYWDYNRRLQAFYLNI
jgi:hypothetical protein